jgi:hypothetical protein
LSGAIVTKCRFADVIVASDRPLPELPAAPGHAAAEVVVAHEAAAFDRPVRWIQIWDALDGTRLGRSGDQYVVALDGLARFVVSPAADRIAIHAERDASDFRVRHALIHQILPLVMSRRGRCVIHASAVSWRDRIVGFVGRTGAGKSTIAAACASMGAALVTDDSLILERSTGVWRAVPSYPGLRLLPASIALLDGNTRATKDGVGEDHKILLTPDDHPAAFERRTLPLARLLFVSVDPSTAFKAAPAGAAAAIALASQLFRLDIEDASESRRLFESITALASDVPIAPLAVGDGREGLRRAARAVLDSLSGSAHNTGHGV